MKNMLLNREELERKSSEEKIAFPNLTAVCGVQYILRKIAGSELKEMLWLRNKKILEPGYYRKTMPERIVFFPGSADRKGLRDRLEALLMEGEREGLHLIPEENSRKMPIVIGRTAEILLKIAIDQISIPFRVDIEPYKEISVYPKEERLKEVFPQKKEVSFCLFPVEEFLAQGYHRVLDRLELISDLSWYKELYDILQEEAIEGRKIRDSLARILQEKPIPSLEKRLDTLKGYEGYGYMKKKWKQEKKRYIGSFPEWEDTIRLLVSFLEPVFEAIQKDEIFFGDWMPQLGRYL